MITSEASRLASGAGMLCAASALFAFSKDWTRQVPLDGWGGLVLLVVGLAAVGAARSRKHTLVRGVAAVSVAIAVYLFATFGHASVVEGGAAAAAILLGLATVLVGSTFAKGSVDPAER